MKTLLERLTPDANDDDGVEYAEGLYDARQEVREWEAEAFSVDEIAKILYVINPELLIRNVDAIRTGAPIETEELQWEQCGERTQSLFRAYAEAILALISRKIGVETE